MNSHKPSNRLSLAGVLVFGVLLAAILALPAGAINWRNLFQLAQAPSFNPNYLTLGQVHLEYATPGEYSDPLTPPEPGSSSLPDLGLIDLGLQLVRHGDLISGYVDLAPTLVFTIENVIDGREMGPAVYGSMDGANLTLLSEKVSLLSGGVRLQRQFQMTGVLSFQNHKRQWIGEYRETIWGYAPQPLTIVGSFALDWAGSPTDGVLYLPLTRR